MTPCDDDAEACELTTRGTPLGAATGRSQASASGFTSLGAAVELAALVCPQGCAPTKSVLSPAGGPVEMPEQADTASREDHDFCNPPPTASKRRQRRRFSYELRDRLRPVSSKRVFACGRKRVAHEVEVIRRS